MRAFLSALPFWLSLVLLALVAKAALSGGIWLLVLPVFSVFGITFLDALLGMNSANRDTEGPETLFWHKLITWIWLPLQALMIFGSLWWVAQGGMANGRNEIYLFLGIGVVSGGVGIVYAHELMHQKNRVERAMGEWLMISVLYGHFVTEHLRVHHLHVATPNDAATARYNESLYRFYARVLPQSALSAWRVEAERQRRRGQPVMGFQNPFWRYLGGAVLMLLLAYGIAGVEGVGLYLAQAVVAVLFLEQVNYMEHYGLVRKRLADGKFEHTQPHHSWNAEHKVSNYLLINLQRHSDHHYKPDRRFPLLQTYREGDAPRLPFGYPLMGFLSLNPLLWRRIMNPRVRRWRALHYPEITDWSEG